MGAECAFLRPSNPAGNGVLFKSCFRGQIDTPFDFSRADDGSVRVVSLRGTIIAGNDRGMLHDKIQEYIDAGGTSFTLDLAQVTYADSTGIGALIHAFNVATRKGGCAKPAVSPGSQAGCDASCPFSLSAGAGVAFRPEVPVLSNQIRIVLYGIFGALTQRVEAAHGNGI